MMVTLKQKGFTLIELLVVISVIAILSSVILSSLQSARQKGKTASIIYFTDNNYHKLGANTILDVRFNDAAGNAPTDMTKNFTSNDSSVTYVQNNTPFSDGGKSADMTGNTTVTFAPSGAITLNDTTGFTESIWVNFGSAALTSVTHLIGNSNILYSGLNKFYIGLDINSTPSINCFLGSKSNSKFSTGPIPSVDNNWHNIVCAFDAKSTKTYLYFDGKQLPFNSLIDQFAPNVTSLNGSITINGFILSSPPQILIDNLQFFSGSLLATEVQKLYAEGRKEHPLASNE